MDTNLLDIKFARMGARLKFADRLPGIQYERDWRCFPVAGTMPFSTISVLASLTAPYQRILRLDL